jgi:hypothetical protein
LQQQQQQQRQLISTQETTDAVKGALGSAWQGLLGLRNKTKEVVGSATETVVSSATAAGQSLTATSTSKLKISVLYSLVVFETKQVAMC